jgi:hypothetical protein
VKRRPAQKASDSLDPMQGIVSVAHDVVNNWFVTGAFDGTVKVRLVPQHVHLEKSARVHLQGYTCRDCNEDCAN